MNNSIRGILSAEEISLGCWLNLCSPLAAEVMVTAGFSWAVVDAEHSAWDLESIAHTFRAIEARGAVPLVRAWDHDPVTAARLLDAGAYGIVFPHVSTPEQAEKLAKAMRYPPRGTRSAGTGRCVTLAANYRQVFDDIVLCIPQIEDMTGIENAEAIADVEGVDIGFIGPNDLSLSMGVAPGHPDHEAALLAVLAAFTQAGKPCGLSVRGVDHVRKRAQQGFRFIDAASDLRSLEGWAQGIIKDLNN
jgi:4-hydroxy-2-oxoheptanedioate aldolase